MRPAGRNIWKCPGGKLIPPEYRFAALEADYESMKDILYGDVPTFWEVIDVVWELEKEIKTL